MDKTNFFLASAAVIPVLVLTTVVGRSIRLQAVSEEAAEERAIILRSARNLVILAMWALSGWAEFVCLRQLETGHVPFGGPTVVWVALVVITLPAVTTWLDPHPGVWFVNVGFRLMYHGLHPDRDIRGGRD
jgi:hypothetical protein